MTRRATTLVLALLLGACGGDDDMDAGRDAASADAGRFDAGVADGGTLDAGTLDAGTLDAEIADAGSVDAGAADAGARDASALDANLLDAAAIDAGAGDAGVSDAGTDAGPAVTCTEPGLTTETITDSASVGTPDTYFRDVRPGDPFCAEITGGGSGTWGVTVSNGTSSGVYCNDVPRCAIRVPAGQTTLLVTALTSDIGFYTLTIRRIPP